MLYFLNKEQHTLNLARLSKDDIIHRWKWKCPLPNHHQSNGLNHPNCYDKFNNSQERIGFVDIESSNLNATFGVIYTYCIKELNGKLYKRAVTIKELHSGQYDKPLLKQFIKDIKHFDRIVTHYGDSYRFDIPFLRTRAVKWNLPFPEYKFLVISDTYPILKSKFKLHSNRLETACDFYDIPCKEHKLNPKIWLMMITGNPRLMKRAISYILRHNEEDVYSLEALWKKIHRFVADGKRSI